MNRKVHAGEAKHHGHAEGNGRGNGRGHAKTHRSRVTDVLTGQPEIESILKTRRIGTKEMEKTRREIDKLERTLSNASFVDRAPKEVVEENRRRLTDYREQAAKLAEGLKRLE